MRSLLLPIVAVLVAAGVSRAEFDAGTVRPVTGTAFDANVAASKHHSPNASFEIVIRGIGPIACGRVILCGVCKQPMPQSPAIKNPSNIPHPRP
jgi:hypothetical protein